MKWFRHMSNASDDEFISELEELFGWEGYGRWWKLLETIAKQMDETDKHSASYSWQKWQTFLKGKRNKLETFLKHLENKQKIKLVVTGNVLEIYCPKLLEMRDNHSKNLQASRGKKLASKEVEVEVYVDDTKGACAKSLIDQIDEIVAPAIVTNTSRLHVWLKEGATEDLILSTIRRVVAKNRNPQRINSLNYFESAIADAIADSKNPMQQSKGSSHGQQDRSNYTGRSHPTKHERTQDAVRRSIEKWCGADELRRIEGKLGNDDR